MYIDKYNNNKNKVIILIDGHSKKPNSGSHFSMFVVKPMSSCFIKKQTSIRGHVLSQDWKVIFMRLYKVRYEDESRESTTTWRFAKSENWLDDSVMWLFLHWITVASCSTLTNLNFAIYQMGKRAPTEPFQAVTDEREGDNTHPFWERVKSLIWKVILVEMRWPHRVGMYAQKGHSCLKYPYSSLENLSHPCTPPFQTWAHLSPQEETILEVYALAQKERLMSPNT